MVAILAGLGAVTAGHVAATLLTATSFSDLGRLMLGLGWAAGGVFLLVATGGLVVVYRAGRNGACQEDVFLALNRARSEASVRGNSPALGRLPLRWFRTLLGSPEFLVGDPVKVRSLREIQATLDDAGSLDGLPFMPEMQRFCGRTGVVFRCVDKIYDYGGRKDFRRMKDVVLLVGLRCDGSAHGGCQAGCYLLWKTAWLERARNEGHGQVETDVPDVPSAVAPQGEGGGAADSSIVFDRVYQCQYTQLVAASSTLKSSDIRQDLRPLITGNVTLTAFVVATLTRVFNTLQHARGGVMFPTIPARMNAPPPHLELHLQPGEIVRVLGSSEIAETLSRRGRNRGLWFDRDMLKHTGRAYRVLCKVDRIIDDVSGRMLRMKSPCIILEGVYSSGEFMRFCAQHDYMFWREVWLARAEQVETPPTRDHDAGG